ncbi:hypothetical protein ASPZODRAFT_1438260 [Penicilliopsis zonata CBS 506.65]|uniref:Calponin-homology (CH) domain-containing protein n=1 Tax=Penicilliopsis zonata CBS 506.65 TaxID=1073090 RepID=A0A1L9SPS3_9EURO|nr:hypothetical protein ASPZODRAFT_1438260 [Penicilliopsis zonata CBS 506.65]OJJ49259.1 hypothetical protein ASPZODRAFT_1438260 [Penicilliopsis zonata CBS 506.65]
MASVSSLDKDLRNMRLSRYTPQAAAEIREWIEEVLHEKLPAGDLLDALKDGVALCRLVNLAVSPGVKYKQSSMPFVQMENISHFLRACQMPPISLPPHDVFLTVDLYESKDPAQVLQCVSAFSRRANVLQPSKFPRSLGAKSKGGVISPHLTGSSSGAYPTTGNRVVSTASESNSSVSGRPSPGRSPKPAISSWSKRSDEHETMPAWNIHQYGYMGGASQGTQGIAFGARRQITASSPAVPSLAEKEKRRREEEEQLRQQQQEAEEKNRRQQLEREAEEQRAREEEQRKWDEETSRQREQERREAEAERRRWDEEKRKWEEDEQRRAAEEKAVEDRMERERQSRKGLSDSRLNGQFLSQYQATQGGASPSESAESRRIKELERELELAKERERQYEQGRVQTEDQDDSPQSREPATSRPQPVPPKPSYDLSSLEKERQLLRGEWQKHRLEEEGSAPPPKPPRPLPEPTATSSPPPKPPRPLPEPTPAANMGPSSSSRPLPDPAAYANKNRVDRFLDSNPAPVAAPVTSHRPADYSSTAEIDAENSRRIASQQKTQAGGWASKSLLEREMERERERQREWEENQKQTSEAAAQGLRDGSMGTAPGQGAWDVHQYGYLGGDSQNRGGPGLGVGGARRQIIGPRPPP